VYIPLQEKVLQRYMKQESVNGLPADLAGYEHSFAKRSRTTEKGGVAMKFEAAYFRTLTSAIRREKKRNRFYAQFHSRRRASEEDYRTLQDYVFRVLIDQAGKLKLPVHFHSASHRITSACGNGNP